MIVRCGACRAELEVGGPGEFLCPACGTRNAVRGGAPGAPAGAPPPGPYDLGGLTVPPSVAGGRMPPQEPGPDPDITWSTCPQCAWKFAHGEAEKLTCPSCRANLVMSPDGLRAEG